MNAHRLALFRTLQVLVILAMVLSSVGVVAGTTYKPARAFELWWQDGFDGEPLDPAWYWVNEDTSTWNLTEQPGFLRIYTSPYGAGGQNLLLREPGAVEFAIETRVLFEPASNFQFAGLVMWQDASNFLALGRAYCDVGPCVGNGIYFDYIGEGTWVGGNFATSVADPSEAFLRLERRGNTFWGYYSEDGSEWTLIGVHQVPQGFSVNGIGLTSSGDADEPDPVPADFDYFAQGPTSDAPPRIVHRYHDYIVAEHFVPAAQVTFTAYEFQGATDPLFEISRVADETGGANLQAWEYPVDLAPGNYVVVNDGSITKDLVLEPVTMDVFDPDLDLLSGTTSPGRALYVYAQNDGTYCSMDVTADDSGEWTANFSGTCDVAADMWTAAMAMDDDGDVSEATRPEPPTGYHDYDTGDVPSWACNAGGWAMDPDFPYEDVNVRILADGIQVMEPFLAQNYREDLEASWNEGGGGCPGGTCAFEVSLWGLIDSYVSHEITVEAQDLQSGEWYPLNSTPKTLTCRTYDIYAYNPTTGTTQQITNLRNADEYDPSWSPDGKKVAHDVVTGDTHGTYVTNVGTGVSTPLKGAQNGGNDPAWSPSGAQIVFDRRWFDDPSLYSLPPAGGKPKLLRHDAVNAAWSPNGKFLAFHQPSDGSLRTVFFAAPGGTARFIGYGEEPAWSPDGKWIAYVKDGDIWKVAVDKLGAALSAPIQLTSGPFSDGGPTWSRDSQTIIYSSGMTRDADLWSVPAAGGAPTWLTGAPEFGEYGPAVGKNSPKIAYASFSPNGQAPRVWATPYTYDAGTWTEGFHAYNIDFQASGGEVEPGSPVTFISSYTIPDSVNATPSYEGYVLLRGAALRGRVGDECPVIDPPVIRPDQPTLFHNGYLSYEVTYAEAVAFFDGATVTAYWDDAGSAQLVHHAVFPWSSVDWLPYICSYTAP